MRKNTLKKLLLDYLNTHDGWHKKVSLFVLGDEWGYSPDSLSRQLRQLAEDKSIRVEYYNGTFAKNLAKYHRNDPTQSKLPKFKIVEINGERKAVLS